MARGIARNHHRRTAAPGAGAGRRIKLSLSATEPEAADLPLPLRRACGLAVHHFGTLAARLLGLPSRGGNSAVPAIEKALLTEATRFALG